MLPALWGHREKGTLGARHSLALEAPGGPGPRSLKAPLWGVFNAVFIAALPANWGPLSFLTEPGPQKHSLGSSDPLPGL